MFLKRLILRMEGDTTKNPMITGEPDNGKYNAMLRTAIELSARIGRLQGIDSEKAAVLTIPERYRAWIDEDGIIHKERVETVADEPSDDEDSLN